MKTKTGLIGLAFIFAGLAMTSGCKEDPHTASLPLLSATTVTEITVNSAFLNGIVLAPGSTDVNSRGFCWSTSPNPVISDNIFTEGKGGVGYFTGRISGLLPGTDYHVRSWATNAEGTSYGLPEMIRTPLTVTMATLETLPIENIWSSSAVSGGLITDIGGGEITERGICWNNAPSPTIVNAKATALITGAASGRFVLKLTSLEPGQTYFLRAYAVNSAGVSYGPELSFITPESLGKRQAYFPGEERFHAVSFSIGERLYLGFGDNSTGWPGGELWEWDQGTSQWTRRADYPSYMVSFNPYGFAIGGKGYIYANKWDEDAGTYNNEFWEYDPLNDKWNQKSSLPVTGNRSFPVAFSIGSKGYIGLGQRASYQIPVELYNDFWEYDQVTDTWSRKADFPGLGRIAAASFSVGNRGYISTGYHSFMQPVIYENGDPLWRTTPAGSTAGDQYLTDFWEYEPLSDRWTRKSDFPGMARAFAAGFSIGNAGFIGAGRLISVPSINNQDFWEWNQASDTWRKTGIIEEGSGVWSGGNVGSYGYFIISPASYNQPVELWTFPLKMDR